MQASNVNGGGQAKEAGPSQLKREPVAKVYAKALFELASEGGVLEAVEKDFSALLEMLRSEPELRQALSALMFSSEDRERLAAEFAKKSEISVLLARFLALLVSKNRVYLAEAIYDSFRALVDASRNIVRGQVTTVEPLTEAEIQDLSQAFARQLNKQVILEPQINKEILGGLIVKIQGKTFDGSLKTTIRQLKENLERQSL